jgi:hypothetical protein
MTSKVSQYFNRYEYKPTHNLIENLIVQNIQLSGTTVVFISKDMKDTLHDTILREPMQLVYSKQAVEIEMLVTETSGMNGYGNSYSFFGVEMGERIVIAVSKKRFKEETFSQRPVEGDIIFFPLNNTMYEIVTVNEESDFLKHGKNFIWNLILNVYSPSQNIKNDFEVDGIDNKKDQIHDFDITKYIQMSVTDEDDVELTTGIQHG